MIVPMTKDHLPEVLAIEIASFHDPWPLVSFYDVTEEPYVSWVALEEGRVIGYLVTLWVLDELHVLNIAVQANMRRRGVGKQFVEFLLEKASAEGIRMIYLEVRISNHAAIEFYRKAGFQYSYRRKAYYDDGEDAWMMERCTSEENVPKYEN